LIDWHQNTALTIFKGPIGPLVKLDKLGKWQ